MPNLVLDTYVYTYIYIYSFDIGIMIRVFANGPGDLGSIPGRVKPKTLKVVLDATSLSTQHYKVRIRGKVEQSREMSSTLLDTLESKKQSKKEPSGHPRLRSPTLLYIYIYNFKANSLQVNNFVYLGFIL